jgi:REP element-mobilizing transposase RayT
MFMPTYRTPPRLRGFDYSNHRTYFITFSTWDRLRIFSDPLVAAAAASIINVYGAREWYWLLAYCVMPDHIHILLRLRRLGLDLARAIATLKNEISRSAKREGRMVKWQPGFYDRVLREHDDPRFFARYVVENPVRAGLVAKYFEYPYCAIVDRWF